MLPSDPLANVLYIDLSKKRSWLERREDLFGKYFGGAGVGIQLLTENCPAGMDPLAPEAPIVLTTGPLDGLFPLASKTVAMFKSPHTGNLGESHAGGRSAVAIRMSGLGAIVITGTNTNPGYLSIEGGKAYFLDATTLWGMTSSVTAGRIIRQNERSAGLRSIMRIGRAGENLVTYADVSTETYRHFGRLGMGHDLGTAENIQPLSALGGLPTRNLQSGRFDSAEAISGEHYAEHYLGRRLACSHCPVACIHIAALREPYQDEAYYYKTTMISYDYEPIYALGSMLGIRNPEQVLSLMDKVEVLGLDAMSSGVCLAWATEAMEKGLVTEQDTGGLQLEFRKVDGYLAGVEAITRRSNEFWRTLGRGVDAAAARYGGADFAMAFGGNEMPGYHTGPAGYLGFMLGARHSHLDNAGYSIDQKELTKGSIPAEQLAQKLMDEERWRQVLSSLSVCFFARGIYTPELTLRALAAAGYSLTAEQLAATADDIYRAKFAFKLANGFDFNKLTIPHRIFETPAVVNGFDEAYMRRAIAFAGDQLASPRAELRQSSTGGQS
ncbi:MAG: aldehyde:ferredoxin oxidoreductase [Caldiserica bacterium]|nr:aldehyde:ferredoxin oxidoreductase [Caldisericota bacterium]